MNLFRAKAITIAHLDFIDLTSGKTNNPLAESEVPEILRTAIKEGVSVIITDPLGQQSCQLTLNKSGQFQYAPLG